MKNLTIFSYISLVTATLLSSCGSDQLNNVKSEPRLPNSIKSQSLGYACVSDMPADTYASSVLGSCTSGYEPLVAYDRLANNLTICDVRGELPYNLENGWAVTNWSYSPANGCSWSGGNRGYYSFTITSLGNSGTADVCASNKLSPGWQWTSSQRTWSCNNTGRSMTWGGYVPASAVSVVTGTLSGSSGMTEPGTGITFARPNLDSPPLSTASIKTLSTPLGCVMDATGPYFRRQTIPALSGSTVAPAYVTMSVQLPALSQIFLNKSANSPAGWIYLGGSSINPNNTTQWIDAGLFFDTQTNSFGIAGQTKLPGAAKATPFNVRINNVPARITAGSKVQIEFYMNAQNQPTLRVTSDTKFKLLSGSPGKWTWSDYNGAQTLIYNISAPASAGWTWNPSTSSNGYGQPLKAMVSLAFNDLGSTANLSQRADKFNGIAIESLYPGIITGFSADGSPIVKKAAWPKTSVANAICKTQYVTANGDFSSSGSVDINLPLSNPTDGGGGGGGTPN